MGLPVLLLLPIAGISAIRQVEQPILLPLPVPATPIPLLEPTLFPWKQAIPAGHPQLPNKFALQPFRFLPFLWITTWGVSH